jgi:hypothetical protein
MIQSYWNSLRVHDEVFVHDDTDRGFKILPGTVAFAGSAPGSNNVTIRIIDANGTSRLVLPKRLAVHLAAPMEREGCWRCGLRR